MTDMFILCSSFFFFLFFSSYLFKAALLYYFSLISHPLEAYWGAVYLCVKDDGWARKNRNQMIDEWASAFNVWLMLMTLNLAGIMAPVWQGCSSVALLWWPMSFMKPSLCVIAATVNEVVSEAEVSPRNFSAVFRIAHGLFLRFLCLSDPWILLMPAWCPCINAL